MLILPINLSLLSHKPRERFQETGARGWLAKQVMPMPHLGADWLVIGRNVNHYGSKFQALATL